jgi:hypothetical protein
MGKVIFKIGFSLVLSFMLFSCGSAPPAMSEAPGETSRSGGSENDGRMIAYTVSMQLAVDNVEETRRVLTEQIENFNGYITRESDNYITTRIPVENMDSFLNTARTFGKVESETKTGVDISEQYRDDVIRLESLRNIRDRYLTLLRNANTISDILNIERELERVNTEIEVMEGRIQRAQMSVAYSSITVRFNEKLRPGPIGLIFYGLWLSLKWLFVL